MSVELFSANQAVSTCTVEGGIEWTFDCMYGPNTDTRNVITNQLQIEGSCKSNIGYAAGYTTARDYSSKGSHSSNVSRAQWSYNEQEKYLQVEYFGGQGLFYADSDDWGGVSTDAWSMENGYVKHAKKGGLTHHMVAPVINTQTINANW